MPQRDSPKSGLSPRSVWPPLCQRFPQLFPNGHRFEDRKRNSAADATLSSLIGRADHDKASRFYHCSFVSKAPEQLFDLTQDYIRPLIGLIDRLNEVGAEDELRVIAKQLTRLVYRAQSH